MKEQSNIPTGKVERASRFVATGVKVGANYLKHYTKKLIDPSTPREELHADNAEDIYDTLALGSRPLDFHQASETRTSAKRKLTTPTQPGKSGWYGLQSSMQ